MELSTSTTPCDTNEGFTVNVPLTPLPSPLNVTLKDDTSFNVPILHTITQRYPWRNHLPSKYCYNSWIIAINEEEPITASGALDTLNYLRMNGATEVTIQLHKRTT